METELHRTSSLRADGVSYPEIRRMRRDGELISIRRGAYLSGPRPDEAHERHRFAVRAAAVELCPLAVISHISAAVLHGLPTWRTPLTRVHATRARASGGRRNGQVHVHAARLSTEEVTVIDGIRVTDLARTVIDVSRTTSFEEGVVVADAALASGLVDRARLVEAAVRVRGRRGAPLAMRVAEFADGRAESVGESRSRVGILRAGLPAPVPQWAITNSEGWLLGRSDFGWPEHQVAGEFDGRVKYGRLLVPGVDPAEIVYREKMREDRLRRQLRTVVRWTWADLDDFASSPAAADLRHALA